LVTLGSTAADEWVFVDVESLGAISVDGDRQQSLRLVRSLIAELALQPLHHYVDVTVVGMLDAPSVPEQGLVAVDSLDESLVRRSEQAASDKHALLDNAALATTIAARVHGVPRDGLVANVVVVDEDADAVLLDRLAEAAIPGSRGVGLVSLDPFAAPATQLAIDDHGVLEIPHLALTVRAVGLDVDQLGQIDEMLRHEMDVVTISEPAPDPYDADPPCSHEALDPLDMDAGRFLAPADDHESMTERPDAYEEPKWDYCVRVFADHQVTTPVGDALSFRYGENPAVPNKNTNRGPELLAYLALRADRSARLDEVRDHLWWGRSIGTRSVDTLISGTRGLLGGTAFLSRADDQPAPGRYKLGDTVLTDVELLEHALTYAQTTAQHAPHLALDALRPQLDDIRAAVFRSGHLGSGLANWAAAYRVLDRAEQSVIDAALLAAELLSDQGLHGLADAMWAIDHGLRACPTNEALVRAGMHPDARSGHREAAQHRYDALATQLARDELEPEPETTDLFNQIMRPNYRIG
jgi:hypothetical protein